MFRTLRPQPLDDNLGRWRIYRDVVPGYSYVLGADSASGLPGRNKSAIQVLCLETNEQVASFSAECPPEKFAIEIEMGGNYFNEALAAIEDERYGRTVLHILKDRYGALYYHADSLTGMEAPISRQYGWNPMGTRNRQTAIDLLKMDIGMNGSTSLLDRQNALKIYDLDTLREMQFFTRDEKGKEAAQVGKTDDLLAALWISNFVRHELLQTFRPKAPEKKLTIVEEILKRQKQPAGRYLGQREHFID